MPGNDSFTKLLLHCDGADASTTFTDASSSARGNATVSNNGQVDTAQSVFGGGSYLSDGSGDSLSYANSADWNFGGAGAGDFTIDFRLRFAAVTGNPYLIAAYDGSVTGWYIHFGAASNTLRIGTGAVEYSLAWTPSVDTWYHWAIVRSGGTVTVYINGTSIGTVTDFDWNNDSRPLVIGATTAGGSNSLNGWMDEIRVSKGIARWTTNFTPPTEAYSDDELLGVQWRSPFFPTRLQHNRAAVAFDGRSTLPHVPADMFLPWLVTQFNVPFVETKHRKNLAAYAYDGRGTLPGKDAAQFLPTFVTQFTQPFVQTKIAHYRVAFAYDGRSTLPGKDPAQFHEIFITQWNQAFDTAIQIRHAKASYVHDGQGYVMTDPKYIVPEVPAVKGKSPKWRQVGRSG